MYVLVAIPLLTVIGLYGFVLYTTVGDAVNLDRAPNLINATSVPAAKFDLYVQNERRASMIYLVAPNPNNQAQLTAAQAATAQNFPSFRSDMTSAATTQAATTGETAVINTMIAQVQQLAAIRPKVVARAVTPAEVMASFSAVLSEELKLFVQENQSLTNGLVSQESEANIVGVAGREALSQEDAVVSAALAAGQVTPATRVQVSQLAGARQASIQDATSFFNAGNLAAFNKGMSQYTTTATLTDLTQLEDAFGADTHTAPPFTTAQWNPVANAVLAGYFAAGVDTADYQVQHDDVITSAAWRRVALAGGIGLLGLILSVLLSVLIGRRIVRRLGRLEDSAVTLANEELPEVVTRLRRGEDVPVERLASTTSDLGKDEIGRVGLAFDAARRTAVEAAVGEARMRRGINDVFRNLARRNQSLLHRELTVLDGMERRTTDPETLEDLFRLDHLTTRMRRHSEGLIILSGAAPGRGWVHPVRMIDVLRAAAAEVEDYSRVTVTTPSQVALAGPAVADIIHLLAELIENATTLSPPYTPVRVSGDMVASGFAVEIEDRGLGMSEPRYADLNHRLDEPPEFDVFNSEQLGLFVVGQLAKRHGIRVTLRPSPYGGTTAIALIPTSLVGTDDGFMEGLPAGASAAPSAWPQEGPAQITGPQPWGALPQGNGTAAESASAPNGNGGPNGFSPVNGSSGSHGAGPLGESAAPADPFESYTGPSFGTAPYEAAGDGNGGSSAYGFSGPPGESSSFGRPGEAPFGTSSDSPSETGLPWPYDKPTPAGPPSFTPAGGPGDSGANRPPFPSAPFPGADRPYQPTGEPPYQPTGESPYPPVEAADPSYPAADAPLPRRSESRPAPAPREDSRPSLPLRRRNQTAKFSTEQPQPQFGAEPPTFTPEPAAFSPQPPQFGTEPPQFGTEPPQFGTEPPRFTPGSAAFSQQPGAFTPEPPAPEPPVPAAEESTQAMPTEGDVDESYKGLPRRVRQANLAPQLRDAPVAPGSPAVASGDNVANRSPDDIRSALSAMQRGWQQGREDGIDHPGGGVASGHLPSGAETENTRSSDEGSRGGNDES
jgi:hypothetical protein